MIDDATYAIYRAACDKADAWINTQRGKGGWSSWRIEDAPEYVSAMTNDIRAEVEEYEIRHFRPRHLTLYVDPDSLANGKHVGWHGRLTGWTGTYYGAFHVTKAWCDRHGNYRCQVRARIPEVGEYAGQWSTVQQCVNLRKTKDI